MSRTSVLLTGRLSCAVMLQSMSSPTLLPASAFDRRTGIVFNMYVGDTNLQQYDAVEFFGSAMATQNIKRQLQIRNKLYPAIERLYARVHQCVREV